MDKVKITVNQENVLKEFNDIWKDKTVNDRYEIFLMSKKVSEIDADTDFLKPLTEIDSKDFFFMLHGWYEVEQPKPKFKVGDWVYGGYGGIGRNYFKVTKEVESDERTLSLIYVDKYQEYFEKVTEKWKIVLLELGREKLELKVGDKFITTDSDNLGNQFTVTKIENMQRLLKYFKNVKYFYPVESRIEVKQ